MLALLAMIAAPTWAQTTFHGNNARGPIVTSPSIAGGLIYISSLDGHLYAVDQETGKEKWNFKSRMPIVSSPAIASGKAFFVSSAGALVALDAATGEVKWVFATEFERKFEAKNLHGLLSAAQTVPDAWDVFTSSPAVANGKVYFGSGDGNVYAVDAESGVLHWKYATRDIVHASPAIDERTVYIGGWDSYLYALDAETGQERWSFKSGEDPVIHNQVGFQSSPAVVDGTVFVGCRDAHVYALDAATGRKKWDYPTSKSWVIGTPAVRDGTVYVGTSDSSRFMGLDAKTGRLRFNFDTGAYVFSSAALAGGLAYFGAHNGRLYALDVKTGRLVWSFQTEAAKKDPLKVLDPSGGLNRDAFTPVFGDFEDMYIDFYRFISVGAIMGSPAVAGGVLYVGSMDGNLYALQ